jgi:hypothetical protein
LAWEVVDQEETGYDQARALETYLRAYTYTLDLPPPPNDVDLVDHFLFSQQEGYCDYYASAMVVMARTVGIPARLAAGYAQGTYDHEGGRWVVTEQDAHSWVEIYFRGIGWIEFEPTAGQPALDRLGGAGQPRPDVPPIPPRALAWWHQIPWELIGIAALAGLALIAIIGIYIWRRRQDLVPTALVVVDRYGRLLEWGRRLGQPLRDGQTPLEYGHALSEALRTQAQSARWSKVRQAGFEAPQEIEFLVTRCIRTQYGSRPVPERTSWSIDRRWNQLRRRLWWLWLDRHL